MLKRKGQMRMVGDLPVTKQYYRLLGEFYRLQVRLENLGEKIQDLEFALTSKKPKEE